MKINCLAKLGALALLSLVLSACSSGGNESGDSNDSGIKLVSATDDSISDINGSQGVKSVLDVFANDFVQGNVATTSNVSLTETSADPSGVLNLNSDGTVDVAANSPAGSYSLGYQICMTSNSSQCDSAIVTVNTVTLAVSAVTDSVSDINGSVGATNVLNVFANDTFDGVAATLSNVDFSIVTEDTSGVLSIDGSGNVSVAANSAAGTYTIEYQICETGAMNCSSTTASVTTVVLPVVTTGDLVAAVNGSVGASNVVNVLDNDTFDGQAASLSNVTLTQTMADASGVLSMDDTGSVSVASDSAAGSYMLGYEVCEAGTMNCASATVSVTVVVLEITTVADSVANINGSVGASNVLNVLTNDTFAGQAAGLSNVTLIQTEADPSGVLSMDGSGNVSVAANSAAGTYLLGYQICEIGTMNCASTTVSVEVVLLEVIAFEDIATDINGSIGATNILNVLTNDTIDGVVATLSNVDLSVVTADPASVVTMAADGNVSVAADSPAGTFLVEYRICEKGTSNCAQNTVSVTTVVLPVVATADSVGDVNASGGVTGVINVLANDTFNGQAATLDAVDLSVLAGGSDALTINADGSVDVADGTLAGTYTKEYQICEAATLNCSSAMVEVTVTTLKGVFMKGEVAGLKYETDTQSGVTNENGEFLYQSGETISFFIGGTQLGETVEAKAEMNPMDLVPGVTLPETGLETLDYLRRYFHAFGSYDYMDLRFELANILIFIYSVDNDKDLDTNVVIDEAVHLSFANITYDLKADYRFFEQTKKVRDQFYIAFNDGGIANARIYRQSYVLDKFYAHLGLTPQVYVQDYTEFDSNADGILDSFSAHVFTDELLYSGYRSTNTNRDEDYFFNEYGDDLGYARLNGSRERRYEYDIHGERVLRKFDNNGDGIFEFVQALNFDNFGKLISQEIDTDGDTVVDQRIDLEYDSQGRHIKTTTDLDPSDPQINQVTIREYDANGFISYIGKDNDADGNIDEATYYTNNAEGRLLLLANDNDNDGAPENTFALEYDANGNNTRAARDNDGDGVEDAISLFSYNESNRRTLSQNDNDGDGVIDSLEERGYDANGNQTLYREDTNNDGVYEYLTTSTFDANNNRLTQHSDWNGDGVWDRINENDYDVNNNLLESRGDWNGDGSWNRVDRYTYDANGNRIRLEQDDNDDGVIDRIGTYASSLVNFLGWYTLGD